MNVYINRLSRRQFKINIFVFIVEYSFCTSSSKSEETVTVKSLNEDYTKQRNNKQRSKIIIISLLYDATLFLHYVLKNKYMYELVIKKKKVIFVS